MDFAVFPYIKSFLRGMPEVWQFKWIKISRNECNISHENWLVCANVWWLGKATQEMCGT
jgi:hypothetical protein